MAMKQTQTKLFEFSDVGLDFCAGSKNLFPDRFKKMLSLGYNEKTVASVSIVGNQLTFDYGGVHGYVADRVLKVNSGTLAAINGGEFWIDSVTTNTVTFTLDDPPLSIANGFTTKIASLGWTLEYENVNIQIYKLKNLDETDVYLRLCYSDVSAHRNYIAPSVGNSFDLSTGFITDEYALSNKNVASPSVVASMFRWEFTGSANATHNNATFSQGVGTFGSGFVVGSLYHILFATNASNGASCGVVNGLTPQYTHDYPQLNFPLLLGYNFNTLAGLSNAQYLNSAGIYIGGVACSFTASTSNTTQAIGVADAAAAYISLDEFNTTTAEPFAIYERSTRQHLGYIAGGLYKAKYAANYAPSTALAASPLFSYDIDLEFKVIVHHCSQSGMTTPGYTAYFAIPIEEIKYA